MGYDDWCDKYDEDLVIVGNYTGHTKCVEAFLKLGLDRKVAILDLAAGTGLLGAEVGAHGYECVDGLDASLGMLGQARKQTIYQDYIVAMVDGLGSIPINDSTLTKEFKHLAVDIYMTDAKTIKVEKWFGKKKQIAAVRTVCSHIKNMFKGLTLGYLYKMR